MKYNPFNAMPRRVLLVFALLITATGGAFAQQEHITLSRSQLTGAQIFDEIQAQTTIKIGYDKTVFDSQTSFTLSKTQNTVEGILSEMFRDLPVGYKFQGKIAFLSPKKLSGPRPNPAQGEPRTDDDRYIAMPQRSIGSVSNPRPVAPRPEPQPVTVEVIKQREFPASASEYTALDYYTRSYKHHPSLALKTNLLYAGAALTPNLGFEFGVGPKSTVSVSGSYSWWGRKKDKVEDYKQWVHSVFNAEYRWWLCERFNGHFFGAHLLYGRYNISGYDVPLLFDKEYRYDGHAFGAGVSYGYNWALSKRWGLEFNLGLGYAYMKYDKFGCQTCDRNGKGQTKHYFGPTKIGINLVYLIK